MIYFLDFHHKALKEWNKLNYSIKIQFQKKIKEKLVNPRVEKDKLSGYDNVYKIKLRSSGFRLTYKVKDKEIVVYVVSIEKRENKKVYDDLRDRI